MNKQNLLILFGGESNEHEVSLKSASNVIDSIDKDEFNLTTIGITKDGKWWLYEGKTDDIRNNTWKDYIKYEAIISPSKNSKGIVILKENGYETKNIDVCFPVLHGRNGEDGTVQGLLQLAGIPCVGGNTLSMALAMDKKYSKIIFEYFGIPVVPVTYIDKTYDFDKLKNELTLPVFVKPANSGSSVGCHKVTDISQLKEALDDALLTDNSVLIEKYIDCREIEFAILGNDEPMATMPGEITSDSGFYDYETKYINTSGVNIIAPADISKEMTKTMQEYAIKAYKALGLSGFSRVDFFVDKKTNEIYLNEINTIPGFTASSMYPYLMQKENIPCSELTKKLIEFAKNRKWFFEKKTYRNFWFGAWRLNNC